MFMISAVFIGILKVLLVIAILAGMVMILLGISIVAHTAEDSDSELTNQMRDDIKKSADVIGRHSVFRSFISNGRPDTGKKR